MNESLWNEYLSLIDIMSDQRGMYGLDDKRSILHHELSCYYTEMWNEFIPKRFAEICHNLDKVIDFNPPLKGFDHIKFYAHEIGMRMLSDLKNYCIGHTNTMPIIKK